MSKLLEVLSRDYLQMLLNGKAENKLDFETYMQIIAKSYAKKNHEAWCKRKREDGYVYGDVADDENKTSNLLVDFNDLPNHNKQSQINNAKAVLEVSMQCGYAIGIPTNGQEKEKLISLFAESIHDKWVMSKIREGYSYGEIQNDIPENGPLTHRAMIPFKDLLVYYPEDAEQDMQTAKSIIDGMLENGYLLVKFAG